MASVVHGSLLKVNEVEDHSILTYLDAQAGAGCGRKLVPHHGLARASCTPVSRCCPSPSSLSRCASASLTTDPNLASDPLSGNAFCRQTSQTTRRMVLRHHPPRRVARLATESLSALHHWGSNLNCLQPNTTEQTRLPPSFSCPISMEYSDNSSDEWLSNQSHSWGGGGSRGLKGSLVQDVPESGAHLPGVDLAQAQPGTEEQRAKVRPHASRPSLPPSLQDTHRDP